MLSHHGALLWLKPTAAAWTCFPPKLVHMHASKLTCQVMDALSASLPPTLWLLCMPYELRELVPCKAALHPRPGQHGSHTSADLVIRLLVLPAALSIYMHAQIHLHAPGPKAVSIRNKI